MLRADFLFILLILFPFVNPFTCDKSKYQVFLNKFGLQSSNLLKNEQYNQRLKTYCANLKYIQEINSQNLSYKLGEYEKMDRLEEQNKRSVYFQQNFTEISQNNDYKQKIKVNAVILPESVDWRTSNDVSSIKKQGDCGCCWAFTAVGLYESWMMVKGQDEYDLSEEYILQCTNPYTKEILKRDTLSNCTGGYFAWAASLLKLNGAPLQSTYPYKGLSFKDQGPPYTQNICKVNQTLVYASDPNQTALKYYTNLTVNQMKQLIAKGPVGALIYSKSKGFEGYKSGVYSGCPSFDQSYKKIDHSVIIVGYDKDGNYIIKNSWGTEWGENGFGRVSVLNDCALSSVVIQFSSSAVAGNGLKYTDTVKFANYPSSTSFDSSILCFYLLIFLMMVLSL